MSKPRRGLKSNPFEVLERVRLRGTNSEARVLDIASPSLRRYVPIRYFVGFDGMDKQWWGARHLEAAPESETE